MVDFILDLIIGILVLAVVIAIPVGMALYTVYQNLYKPKSPQIAGYIYDGSIVFKWMVIVLVAGYILDIILMILPDEWTAIGSIYMGSQPLSTLVILGLLQVTLIFCYIMVSFRPATAEELAEAKGQKMLTIDVAKVFTGIGGLLVASLAAIGGAILMALNPINVISVIGNTVTYTIKSAGTMFIGVVMVVALVVWIILVILYMMSLYMVFFVVFCAIAIIIRFFIIRKRNKEAFVDGESTTAEVYAFLKGLFKKAKDGDAANNEQPVNSEAKEISPKKDTDLQKE